MQSFAQKVSVGLKSRTVWTFVVLFILNGIDGVRDSIPANVMDVLNPILTIVGMYFRVTPKSR